MAEPAAPGRRRRPIPIILALLLLLALALWQGAPRLVQTGLLMYAEASGLEPRTLEVRRVGWRHAEIENIVLGEARDLEIRRISARYSPRDLLRMRFDAIRIEGLRLRARVDREGLAPGVLASLLEAEGGGSLRCEDLRLADGRIGLDSPLGRVEARAEGEAALRGPRGVQVRASLSADEERLAARVDFTSSTGAAAAPPRAGPFPSGRGTLNLTARDAAIHGYASGLQGSAEFELVTSPGEVRITAPGGARLEAKRLDERLLEKLPALAGLRAPLGGPLSVALEAAGESAPLVLARARPAGWDLAWDLDAAVRAAGGALLQAASRGSATIPAGAESRPQLAPSSLTLEARGWKSPAGEIAKATLHLGGKGPLDALAGSLEAHARGRAEAGESAGRIPFEAALRGGYELADGALRVTPAECLSIELDRLGLGTLGEADALQLCLEAASGAPLLSVTARGKAPIAVALRGALRPARLRIHTHGDAAPLGQLEGDTPLVEVAFDGGGAGAPTFRLKGEGGRLLATEAGVAADGAGFDLTVRAGAPLGAKGIWRVGRIAGVGKRPLLAPVALSGSVDLAEGAIAFTALLENRGKALSLQVDGSHSLESGKGSARVALAPLRFKPGKLRPRDLLPVLGRDVDSARGSVEASGTFRWRPGRLETPLRLRVKGLSFDMPGLGVEGLDADVRFRRSLPPWTEPGQVASLARAESGVALTEGRVVFAITEEGNVEIERIAGRTLGGALSGSGWAGWRGWAGNLRIGVTGLELADLLALIDLEGLTGTGTLDGVIPMKIVNRRILVQQAHFEGTAEKGWIRYRPRERPGFFPAGDERLDLALAILDNFRYDSLEIGLDGPLFEQTDLAIDLGGANPEVASDRPVELHFRVNGYLLDLLRGATATSRIGETLGRRLREGDEKADE